MIEADRCVESLIRDRLGQRFPRHRIVGEEHGASGDGATCWVIDPIDGTRAFISGMPTWGIRLGLVVDGRADARLSDTILYSTHPSMFQDPVLRTRYDALSAQSRLQRWGGDCYGFALVAQGMHRPDGRRHADALRHRADDPDHRGCGRRATRAGTPRED